MPPNTRLISMVITALKTVISLDVFVKIELNNASIITPEVKIADTYN